jgi:hypothetical protein
MNRLLGLGNSTKRKTIPGPKTAEQKEKQKKYRHEYYLKNIDYEKARVSEWQKANKEKINERNRKAYADNTEAKRAYHKAWRDNRKGVM